MKLAWLLERMGLFKKNKIPTPDYRPSIFMQQWLQYQLDNHDSVDKVVHMRISAENKAEKGCPHSLSYQR